MRRRATQKDIAQACGCSPMAVSYTLRGIDKVSPELRARIREAALRLAYSPDPGLSALVAHRRNVAAIPAAAPLAWITNYPDRDLWLTNFSFVRNYYEAASRRAAEFGHRLETFWLREPGMTSARLCQILYARGISGLLVAPQSHARAHLNLDWAKFSAVTFGYSLTRPYLHMATTHFARVTVQLMRKLRSLGYRRIGFFMNPAHDARMDHNYLAPYLFEQGRLDKGDRIPPLLHPTMERLPSWISRHRPDCIVTDDGGVVDWLRGRGYRIPQRLGVAHLGSVPGASGSPLSGMDHNLDEVGVAAVDLLMALIQRRERGVPAIRRSILIEGSWNPGKTVRRVVAVRGKKPGAV